MKKIVTIAVLGFICCSFLGSAFVVDGAEAMEVPIPETTDLIPRATTLEVTTTPNPVGETTNPNRISSNSKPEDMLILKSVNVDNVKIEEVEDVDEESTEDIKYEGFDLDTDYSSLIVNYMYQGNIEEVRAAIEARNLKIEALGLQEEGYYPFTFEELNDLSRIINQEAGSSWLPMEWKMGVGEVVLNRVNSSEFKDTIHDVIVSPGQYGLSGATSGSYFYTCRILNNCVEAAVRLFNGERVFNDPSVVFQSQGVQGSGICKTMYDPTGTYTPTYFCYSSRPSLY